jgi:class 3 adenylate cyclase/pimeloyl-ACP methyl ester carboxylesterase
MEEIPETRYTRGSGVNVAYQVFGHGPPLAMVPLMPAHLDLMWVNNGYAEMLARLARVARVVVYDPRGIGLSDPIDHVPTLEEYADDLEAVLDAAGIERATLFGVFASGLTAAMFAARAPQRVDGLVLLWPYAQGARAFPDVNMIVGYDEQMERTMRTFEDIVEHHWGEGRTLGVLAPGLDSPSLRRSWGMLERASASPATVQLLRQAGEEIDLEETLKTVTAHTVVLTTRDGCQPEAITRHVADLVPDSDFHVLPASSEAGSLAELLSPAIEHVERILTHGRTAPPNNRALATVMFTDIVGSTELAARLGDREWRALLGRQRELLQHELAAGGGRLVDTTGDGALSIFDGPARAIRCGVSLIAAVRGLGLELRVGLHTGECELVGDDVAGIAVHTGARVGALAQGGEVWVSRTVRDLVAGSGIEFDHRGRHELKGVPGEWDLFSVASQTTTPAAVRPEAPTLRPVDRVVLRVAQRSPKLARAAGQLAGALTG